MIEVSCGGAQYMDNITDYRQLLQRNLVALKEVLALPVHTPKNAELMTQLNYETMRNNAQKVLTKAELALSFEATPSEIEELCHAAKEAHAQYQEAYTRYVVIDFEQFNIAAKRVQKALKDWDEHVASSVVENEKQRIQQQVNTILVSKNELTKQVDIDRATNQLIQINQKVLQQLHHMQMAVEAIKGLVQRAQTRLKEELNPYVRYNATSLKTYHQFRFQLKQALEKAQFVMEDGFTAPDLVSVKESLEVALTGYEFSKSGLEVLEIEKVLQIIEQLEVLCNTAVDLTDKTYRSAKSYTQSKLAALEVAHQARLVVHQATEQDDVNHVYANVLSALGRMQQAQSDLRVQLETNQLERMIYLVRHHIQSNENQLGGYSTTSVLPYRMMLERAKEHCEKAQETIEKSRSQEEVDALTRQAAELLESMITAQANLEILDNRSYHNTLQRVKDELSVVVDVSDMKEESVSTYERARFQLMSLEKVAYALVDKMSEQDEIDSIQQQLETELMELVEARRNLVPKVDRASLVALVEVLESELQIDENQYAYDTLAQFKELSVRLTPMLHNARRVAQTAQTQGEIDVAVRQLNMAQSAIDEMKEKMQQLNDNSLEQIVAELKVLIAESESGAIRMSDSYRDAIGKGRDYLRIIDTIQHHTKTQAVIDELVSVIKPILDNIKAVKPR